MSDAQGHSLDSFISSVLADGVKRMVYDAGLGYLSAGLIAVGIEFLGACFDRHAFNVDRQSKKRFQKGINEFMFKVNPKYRSFNRKNSRYCLYKQLRCGMAHVVRPHGKVAFVGRGDALKDGLKHLEVYEPLDKLVIVVEDFCDDFITACADLRERLPAMRQKKLKDVFLPVYTTEPPTTLATDIP